MKRNCAECGKEYYNNFPRSKFCCNRCGSLNYSKNHPVNIINNTPFLKLRFEIFKRDNFKCIYCGRDSKETILEVEHVTPRKIVGNNYHKENLVCSCRECNLGKGDTLLSEREKQRIEELKDKKKTV